MMEMHQFIDWLLRQSGLDYEMIRDGGTEDDPIGVNTYTIEIRLDDGDEIGILAQRID